MKIARAGSRIKGAVNMSTKKQPAQRNEKVKAVQTTILVNYHLSHA
jgi:hypothetical protein